jgi:hypothetical protein
MVIQPTTVYNCSLTPLLLVMSKLACIESSNQAAFSSGLKQASMPFNTTLKPTPFNKPNVLQRGTTPTPDCLEVHGNALRRVELGAQLAQLFVADGVVGKEGVLALPVLLGVLGEVGVLEEDLVGREGDELGVALVRGVHPVLGQVLGHLQHKRDDGQLGTMA